MYYGEELNSITYLVGATLALVGLGALLAVSILHRDPWMITSFAVFGGTLTVLYIMSTLYHSFYPPGLKRVFQKLDHVSIYLLIAHGDGPTVRCPLRIPFASSHGRLLVFVPRRFWHGCGIGSVQDQSHMVDFTSCEASNLFCNHRWVGQLGLPSWIDAEAYV